MTTTIRLPLSLVRDSVSDKDECAPGYTNNCDTNANCVNSVGSYKCECQYGYTGDGVTCDSICPEPTTTTATATAGS
ncbi:hypothetical protein LSAT2_009863 [Lamellibrachia satsuma]|nr:hypothetical protein LSAT2_009863 [Lamellibrachia satsuma]